MTDNLVPFEKTDNITDTFGAIKDSIRNTLIVSDRYGYELIWDLVSGISFNHSISAIIILMEDEQNKDEELKKWVENFNNKDS